MSQWWSVAGLVADMIGVAIITWDVIPEHLHQRLRERSAFAHDEARAWLRQPRGDTPVTTVIGEMFVSMAGTELNTVRRKARLPPVTWMADGDGMAEVVERSREEVEEALLARRAVLERRVRPPLVLGALLVVLGFALQTVGAWPT